MSKGYRKACLRILPVLFVTYFVNFLDRVNVSFASPSMAPALGMSLQAVGLAAGLFFIGYFFLEVPSNLMLYRYGARRWLALIAGCWGVLTLLTGLVSAPWEFYVLRLALGATESGFFPGVILYLTWWFPRRYRGRIIGAFLSAIPISGILGGPLSGWVLSRTQGLLGLDDWRWLFFIEGLPCFLVGIWILKGLVDRPAQAAWLSLEEKTEITSALEGEDLERSRGGAPRHFKASFSHSAVWQLCALYFCQMMGLYGLSFWLPRIIQGAGHRDMAQVGLLSAVPWLCALVVMFGFAFASDRSGRRRRWGMAAALLGAAGFLGTPYAPDFSVRILCMALGASGVLSLMAISWSLPASLLGAEAAAAGIALINSFGNLGGFVSPTLIGYVTPADGSLNRGMTLTGSFMLLSGLLLFSFRKLEPAPS